MNWLEKEGFIEQNNFSTISKIKIPKVIRKPFSDVEILKLYDSCSNLRDLAILNFLLATGCRISEMIQLNIDDIDFMNKKVEVVGKGNKARIVYISDAACLRLQEYLNTRTDINPALFVGRGNKRLEDNGVRVMMNKLSKISGVRNVHPHRFRRTKASSMIHKGASIQDVAKLLGHENLSTTQIYCYIADSDTEYAYRKYS